MRGSDRAAATYDYFLYLDGNGTWNTRAVAHNYHYITMSTASSIPYICVKLTHSVTGQNYGDVYCNYYGTGHHYAGDTGTYSWGKQSSFGAANFPYHEEW